VEVRHLRYFTAVASELHFARAAERLNIAPPTLSAQIKWLESYLGVTLFIRSTKRKVELTFAGQQFQKRALALIEGFEQAERFAREAARGEVGDVRLGYIFAAPFRKSGRSAPAASISDSCGAWIPIHPA
jgi:DNA-binding transcriptional LysR family regulator